MQRVRAPQYVSTGEAARALGVSVRSLQQWARDGIVAPDHYTPGGHARWDVEELRSQLQMGRPRPRQQDGR